jgi:hypothetical protein
LGANKIMKSVKDSWEKFLHPGTLRANLLLISLFIAAFEMFKDSVIQKPESFFCDGFNKDGLIISETYRNEVLSKSKSRLHASLLWFQEMGAIDDADLEAFDHIRKHRNEVTHELSDFLANADRNFDITKFQALIELLSKIENWWFMNMELAIDPEILPDGADPKDVIPASLMYLRLMLEIALTDESEASYYYEAFKKGGT